MNWEYLTLKALAAEKEGTALVCTDSDANPVVVDVDEDDVALLLPYSRIFNSAQQDSFGVELPVIPVESVQAGLKRTLKFSREGSLYDLMQLTQPDQVDTSTQPV